MTQKQLSSLLVFSLFTLSLGVFSACAKNPSVDATRETSSASSESDSAGDPYVGLDIKEKENPTLTPSSEIPERREFPVSAKALPCDNFFEYACKPAIDAFALRPDRSSHTFAFNDSYERILKARMKFFEDLPKEKALPRRMSEVLRYYQGCMNENGSKAAEKRFVTEQMEKINAPADRDAFLKFLASRVGSGEGTYLMLGALSNFDNPVKYDVEVEFDAMTLPERSYYHKADVVEAFKKTLVKFYETLGLDRPAERAQWVIDFETKLADSYPLPEEFRELYTQRKFQDRSDWAKKYPALHGEVILDMIPKSAVMRDYVSANLKDANELLSTLDVSKLKSIFYWSVLAGKMDDAYPEFFDAFFQFKFQFLGGSPKRPVRNERCTMATMGAFGPEIDEAMIKKLYPNFPRQKAIDVAEKIRAAIIDGIEKNTWLSAESKKGALAKTKDAALHLVAPTKVDDWDFKPHVGFSNHDRINNSVRLAKALHTRMVTRLYSPRSRTRWGMSPLTVNAYYSPSDNKFVLPQGILQYPMFDGNSSEKENLGGVGAVVGHELGHGIDDKGAQFDSLGRLFQWMKDDDVKKFKELGARFEGLYNAAGQNGKLTLGENIGDLVGLTFAYRAAFPAGEAIKLEDQKKFFLGWAHTWCDVIRPKAALNRLKTDPHSLNWARVNLQVVHQPGFYQAYGCKKGDRMYLDPSERVSIW